MYKAVLDHSTSARKSAVLENLVDSLIPSDFGSIANVKRYYDWIYNQTLPS